MPVIPRTFTGQTSDYLTYHAGSGAPSVADLPTAGSAMVWHNTTLDQIQVWANVAGTLKQLSGGGGGISGTGAAGQVAFWTGSTSIGGDSGLTYASGTLTVGTKVRVGDGATGAPSFTWSGASQMGFFRQPTADPPAEAFRMTFQTNKDRIECRFQNGPTVFPQRPGTWVILAGSTDIWWFGTVDLPATSPPSTSSGSIALTSFSTNVLDIHNYGSSTAYRDTRIRLNRRGHDISGSDAFLELGFTSTSSTSANAQLRIVNAGATSADFNFVIPSVTGSGSRYLFTIGSTSLLTIRGDGGHEINGAGSPNQTALCVTNSGGPPFGRVALAAFASVNGVLNICRYGVVFSESALNSGCQFKRRTSGTGLQPVAADLPEEGEWALWKTATDGLHSIVVRDSGVLTYVGGRRRVLQAADLVTSSTTPVNTDLSVNLLAGFYYIRAVCHIATNADFKIGLSGTAAGTMRISAIRVTNVDTSFIPSVSQVALFTGFGTVTFENSVTGVNNQVVLFEGTFSVSTPGSFTIVLGSVTIAGSITLRMHSYLEISR
jgi:hypothetical protein